MAKVSHNSVFWSMYSGLAQSCTLSLDYYDLYFIMYLYIFEWPWMSGRFKKKKKTNLLSVLKDSKNIIH